MKITEKEARMLANLFSPLDEDGVTDIDICEVLSVEDIQTLENLKRMLDKRYRKVYICLEHCVFGGFPQPRSDCGHNSFDESAVYMTKGDYPLCPLYENRKED